MVKAVEKNCDSCCKKQDKDSNFFYCTEWKADFAITLINQLNCEGTDIVWRGK